MKFQTSRISLLAITLLSAVFFFVGCQTAQQKPFDPVAAAKYIRGRSPLIQTAVRATFLLVTQFVEKDPLRRDELRSQIQTVATNLNALVNAGTVDPSAVTGALKVKEPYINDILSGVAVIYKAEYDILQQNGWCDLAIEILKCVSAGLK